MQVDRNRKKGDKGTRPGEAILKASSARFSYGDHEIFRDVELSVPRGELYCLMGHNGCGKSTLLDCLLGVHPLAEGEILVDGNPISAYKPAELARKISYVPQVHDRSFPYKTRQIVLMGRTAYIGGFGSPGEEDKAIVKQAMEDVGIGHLADRPYTQLSGGEMQMAILARALVQDTPLIIMDEPTAHLDFYNELLFLETAVNLVREGGKTVIMATHSPNQAFYLENQGIPVRVGVMLEGRIFAQGSPSQVLTGESMETLYRIRARVLSQAAEEGEGGTLRQIVPLSTLKRGETNRKPEESQKEGKSGENDNDEK